MNFNGNNQYNYRRNSRHKRQSFTDENDAKAGYLRKPRLSHVEEEEEGFKILELIKQRNEALHKEEAAIGRLKMQEAINTKQQQDLRVQIRKLSIENQKLQRCPSVASYSSKSDRKKDGKSREVRDLLKGMDRLRNENLQLQNKVESMSEFIQIAFDMKEKAIAECQEKNLIIHNLTKENEIVHQTKCDEMERRYRTEGELESIRLFVNYTKQKKRENQRNKSVQTTTSIPVRIETFSFIGPRMHGPTISASIPSFVESKLNRNKESEQTASYTSLKSAASLWQIKLLEHQFKKETRDIESSFNKTAIAAIKQRKGNRPLSKSLPGFSRSDFHSSDQLPLLKTGDNSQNHSAFSELTDEPVFFSSSASKASTVSQTMPDYTNDAASFLPPPPPPPLGQLGNIVHGTKQSHKFVQHSTAIAPAALVYNSRVEVEG